MNNEATNNGIVINVVCQFGFTKHITERNILKETGMTKEEFYNAINDMIENKYLIKSDDGTYNFYERPCME